MIGFTGVQELSRFNGLVRVWTSTCQRSFEPWIPDAVESGSVDILHPFLSRNTVSVSAENPIYFNKKRYSSWEALRVENIQHYSGAKKHLNWEIIQSWLDCDIIEPVPEAEKHTCTLNPLQVVEDVTTINGKLVPKHRPVLHCKIKETVSYIGVFNFIFFLFTSVC